MYMDNLSKPANGVRFGQNGRSGPGVATMAVLENNVIKSKIHKNNSATSCRLRYMKEVESRESVMKLLWQPELGQWQ